MEFPRPLRFEHLHDPVIQNIESIVGVHNGVMSMICVKTDGKSYLMSAKLPVRYYVSCDPILYFINSPSAQERSNCSNSLEC